MSDPALRVNTAQIDKAVTRSIAVMAKSLVEYPKQQTCFSCHHQGVPELALSLARDHGYAVDERLLAAVVKHTQNDLRSALDSYRKGEGQPGGVTRAGYAMLALRFGGAARDEITTAVDGYLLQKDKDQSHWRHGSNRPPAEASDFTDTFLATYALKHYGDAAQQAAITARQEAARKWLESATPKDTEDRVCRIWGLKECGAESATIQKAASELLSEQQPDGGWAQLPGAKSDAYATGSVLTALSLAGGVSAEAEAYRRGVDYLLKTQELDGSWHAVTRSRAVQPYFESGFPHGKDQFISIFATAWATAALALTRQSQTRSASH